VFDPLRLIVYCSPFSLSFDPRQPAKCLPRKLPFTLNGPRKYLNFEVIFEVDFEVIFEVDFEVVLEVKK